MPSTIPPHLSPFSNIIEFHTSCLVLIMFKRRKLIHEHRTRQEREKVSRSKLLSHPLLGRLSLRNELGEAAPCRLSPSLNDDVAAYYTASLSGNFIHNSRTTIPAFLVNEKNGAIIFARSSFGEGNDTLHSLRPQRPGHYCGTSHIFEAMPNSFDDMSISTQTQKLLYVSSGARGTRTVLLDLPRDGEDPHNSFLDTVWESIQEKAWQTAVSPNGESFAVAATGGLSLYKMLPDQMSRSNWENYQNPASCEFMAVAFGRDDRTTMAGKRSGIVTFFDARAKGYVSRLRHESAVNVIRLVDENRVVVRGLQQVRYLPPSLLPFTYWGTVVLIPSSDHYRR
jgi:hypothetical protein